MRTAALLIDKSIYRHALCVFVLVASLLATGPAGAATGPDVGCARCIVMTEDGTVLWARNPRDRYPNASTTKMVTALLVAREAAPTETVTVSSSAGSIGGGGLDLTPGDRYSVDALMYAMLLDSSNEAAQALAEHVSTSGGDFVAEMNRYMRSIGAKRSHFANPHGLDAEGHYASAADLALIGWQVLNDPYLAEVVATPRAMITTPRGRVEVENRNELLEGYEGAIGIKTGRTLGAGNVLVAAARRDGTTLVAVAMNSFDSFADSARLLDFGFAQLERSARRGPVVEEGEAIGELVFDSGSVELVAGGTIEGVIAGTTGEVEIEIRLDEAASAPIADGDVLGTAVVELDQDALETIRLGTVPVIARGETAIEEPDRPWWAGPIVSTLSFLGKLAA